jgi:hypothetical protein|tara:strand:+ start:1123 stop:1296 length:174 start_codon:yes stop_codon:yes gene_type:complete
MATYGLTTLKDEHFKHNPKVIQKVDGQWINVNYESGKQHYTKDGRPVIDIFGRFKED